MFGLSCFLGEGLIFLATLLGLGGLVALGEGLRAIGVSAEATRRVVHGGASLFVAATPFLFSRPLPLYVLATLFVLVNAGGQSKGWWSGMHEARPESWGTVTLPLAVLPALAATWSVEVERILILQVSFLVLAVADPIASGVGRAVGRREWIRGATWVGSGVFFGTASFLSGTVLFWRGGWPLERVFAAAVFVAVVATVIEAVARRGWDNLFVVLGIVLVLVPLHEGTGTIGSLTLALAVGGVVWVVAYRSGALNRRGSVGAGLFGASLVGLGGWAWALPGFAFFVLSSALSWLPGTGGALEGVEEDGGPGRTLRQVLANGGVAWGLLGMSVVLPSGNGALRAVCYTGFLGALAAAAADTWATEVGVRFADPPRSLRTLRRVPPGTSGAVSLLGTGAAALGTATVVGAALLADGIGNGGRWVWAGIVVVAGLVGMLADSVAGATVEARGREPNTDRGAERSVKRVSPVRGWPGIDNDVVNLMGTAVGAAAAIIFSGSLG